MKHFLIYVIVRVAGAFLNLLMWIAERRDDDDEI